MENTNAKKKAQYSFLDNAKYVLKDIWKTQKSLIICSFLGAPISVIVSFLGIYLSREIIAAVGSGISPTGILLMIGAVSLALLASNIIGNALKNYTSSFGLVYDFCSRVKIFDKCIAGDYENMESSSGLTRINKAMENAYQGKTRMLPSIITSILSNIIGIISFAAILIGLSVWVLLAVTVSTVSGFFILKMAASWNYRNKDNWVVHDRKIGYLRAVSGDFSGAKDLRLYNMAGWIKNLFADSFAARMKWHKKEQLFGFGVDSLQALLSLVRECVSYGFLVYLIFAQNLSAADFVLYFGVIGGFSGWLDAIVGDFNRLHGFNLGISEMREYFDYPDKANHGAGAAPPDGTFSIEFKNVSYRYEGSDVDIIENLSFKVEKGEKIAIAGINGAGKTTIVKLICGLYAPKSGEILIDGQPQGAYNREDYFRLFSVVFQDIYMLPLSIAKNIACSPEGEIDRQKVREAIGLAGLSSKIGSLPKGMDTRLIKSTFEDAVDFSGGEMQKLALARALYKQGKALLLDEPTAALDPIAESNIYLEYNRMTAGHTAVFVSHRLASTRFCDRILLLEGGKIIECGNHDELMSLGGKYCEMFEIQSHYYKENMEGEPGYETARKNQSDSARL